jgi:hypothetical protein
MLKNGKYDSNDKTKHSSISALPGLDQKKPSSTYWHKVVLLNLKFQLDKFKNNEENVNYSIFFPVLLIIKSHCLGKLTHFGEMQ